jgi:uncharacterized SAM-binding protein YcdF (DUF218 family)
MPFKLITLIAVPLILIAGAIFLISETLAVDDFKHCPNGPQLNVPACRHTDAIVAISGGDTGARTREAIRMYQAGWANTMIFSGAAEDKMSISNAAAMRTQALRAGVPDSAIMIDEQAYNTAGNAAGIKAITVSKKLQRILLVTSAYHEKRAIVEFQRTLGSSVAILGHPAPDDKYWPIHTWWLSPYGWYLSLSELGKLIYLQLNSK